MQIGRSIGAPVCALKLIPLSRPGGPEANTFKHFASNCDSYGKEIVTQDSARTAPIEYPIGFPDPNAFQPEGQPDHAVYSCTSCSNYVPPMVTKKLTGFAAGYCRAKGKLLLDDRLPKYAEGCDSRVFATARNRIADNPSAAAGINVILFPEYGMEFGKPKKVDIVEIHKLNLITKPSDYNSDGPVTDAHKRLGIRAFRRVQDPKGYGKAILIPIMNEDALDPKGQPIFSDEDKARIPRSGDEEKPERYFDHNGGVYKTAIMWRLGQTPALWGPAGVGKTEMFRHVAWLMGLPFQRISITEFSEIDDLIGKMLYSPEKGTHFRYGRIPRGWVRPNILCIDEPNAGPPAVWQAIRPLTDDSKQMVIDQNEGERLPPNKLCYLGMAMNPAWDPRNTGVAPLADADGSRLMHLEIGLPPEHLEKQILLEVLEDDHWDKTEATAAVDILMKIAKEVRQLSDGGHIPISWGLRNQKKVIRIRRYMSWKDAFRMGVTDALEPSVRDSILNVVESFSDDD